MGKIAIEIALHHHENWDGSGYPDGLKGNDIPLSARLMTLADNYDALISKRVYKDAMSFEEARDIILEGCDSRFDPVITGVFLERFDEFVEISKRYQS